jgi:hypothetical protein
MFPNYAQQLEECTTMKSWEAYLVNQMWRRAGEPKQSPSTFRSLNGVHDTHTWVLCMLKLISSRGTFPLFLFEQMESFLQILYVSNNSLTGTVPTHLGEMTALQFVDLSNNGLFGTMPKELVQWRDLMGLNVSANDFTGLLPTELGQLGNLTQFAFDRNNFSGSASDELCLDSRQWDDLEGDCLADATGQVEIECSCCTFCCSMNGSCVATGGKKGGTR